MFFLGEKVGLKGSGLLERGLEPSSGEVTALFLITAEKFLTTADPLHGFTLHTLILPSSHFLFTFSASWPASHPTCILK